MYVYTNKSTMQKRVWHVLRTEHNECPFNSP